MSKKNNNLLNEATVRRFMTLASLKPIGDGFIKERFLPDQETEVNEEEEPMMGMEGEEEAPEMAMDDEMATDEVEPEAEEAAPELESFAREVASAMADAMEKASKGAISVSVEGGSEVEAPAEEAGVEADMDMPADEGEPEAELDVPTEEEDPEELAEVDNGEIEVSLTEEEEDRIVNEVFSRVMKRILKNKLAKK